MCVHPVTPEFSLVPWEYTVEGGPFHTVDATNRAKTSDAGDRGSGGLRGPGSCSPKCSCSPIGRDVLSCMAPSATAGQSLEHPKTPEILGRVIEAEQPADVSVEERMPPFGHPVPAPSTTLG